MFQILPYRNPHNDHVYLLTPGPMGMECILWFGSWAYFKRFIDGLAYFEAVEERQGKHNIPDMVLEAFGEKKER